MILAGVSQNLLTVFGTAILNGIGVPYYGSEGEPVAIGNLPEYTSGLCVDGSRSGGYATGYCGNLWNYQGFRFSPRGLDSIEFPEGFTHTLPQAISDDGKTIVGNAYGENWSPVKAFVWREGQGNTLLDPLANMAIDVSEDGSVIVGNGTVTGGSYFWNEPRGITSLLSYLSANNIGLKGATNLTVTRVSADGTTMIRLRVHTPELAPHPLGSVGASLRMPHLVGLWLSGRSLPANTPELAPVGLLLARHGKRGRTVPSVSATPMAGTMRSRDRAGWKVDWYRIASRASTL